jgi:hypothetical protein
MLSTDRMTQTIRDRGKDLISAGADRVAWAVRDHGKATAIFAGTALALAGAGSASAATIAPAATSAADVAAHHAGVLPGTASGYLPISPLPSHAPLTSPFPVHAATLVMAVHEQAPHAGGRDAGQRGEHRRADEHRRGGEHRRAGEHRYAGEHRRAKGSAWAVVSSELNRQADPAAAAHGQTPAADQLMPVPTSGPQNWMPITQAQQQNATTIVQRALAHRMGIRSAVVAVATAMQESRLLNIGYGTSDSLGLFQQQADMGWGSAQQIMNPAYSANAFLSALAQYQANNPDWAHQPLWQAAQGVQASGFPTAYAQWESQAAHLVKGIAMHLR